MRLIQLQRRPRGPRLATPPSRDAFAAGPLARAGRHWAWRYAAAAGLVLLAASVNEAFPELVGKAVPFLVYFPAVVLAGFIGGLGPGLLATLLSACAAGYLNFGVAHELSVTDPQDRVRIALFLFLGGLLSYVNHLLHTAVRRAREAEATLVRDVTERKRSELALSESQMKYRSLFESMDEGFCIIEMLFDPSGKPVDYRFLEANPAFSRQTGLADALGKTMRELAPGHESHWFETYGRIARTGEAVRFESPASQLGDRWYDVFAWRYGDPSKSQVAVLFNDVSPRKRAEDLALQGERRLRTIIDEMPALISYIDKEERYVFNNKRYLDWFGRHPDTLKGTRIADLLGPARYAVVGPELRRALQGEPVSFENEVVNGGGKRWIHGVFVPDRDPQGAVRGCFAFISDVTEARTRSQTLEAAVQARTEQLASTVADLEAFSYTVSHDLRAPLRAIQGYAYFVLKQAQGRLGAESIRLLERISASTTRMDRLIQDLLAFGRLSRADYEMYPVEVEPIVDHVLEQYSGLRGARIAVVRPLGAVVGQDSLLTQALSNLITNAIKFSPLESQPSVTIRAERKSGRVRIVVEDEGIGIPPAQLAKLFTPFVKLHPESEYEGTGIGLAIVKKAVERMGGTAGAESEPGRGSRFWIELAEGGDAAA